MAERGEGSVRWQQAEGEGQGQGEGGANGWPQRISSLSPLPLDMSQPDGTRPDAQLDKARAFYQRIPPNTFRRGEGSDQ